MRNYIKRSMKNRMWHEWIAYRVIEVVGTKNGRFSIPRYGLAIRMRRYMPYH